MGQGKLSCDLTCDSAQPCLPVVPWFCGRGVSTFHGRWLSCSGLEQEQCDRGECPVSERLVVRYQ